MAITRRGALLACWILAACTARPAARPPPGSAGGGGEAGEGAGGSGGTGTTAGCTDEPPPVAWAPDGCLQFGTVMLGLEKTLPLEVANLSSQPVSVCLRSGDPSFQLASSRLDLPGRGAAEVDVRFFPPARGTYEAELRLTSCRPCTERAVVRKVCMTGMTAVESFTIEPSPIHFGTRRPGTTTCQNVVVRNTGDVSIYVRDIRLDDGLKRVPGTFELRLGDIQNNKEIRPGEAAAFQLCFTPARVGAEYSGNLFVYTDNQPRKVAVTGRGGGPCFAAIPESLDLGATMEGVRVGGRTVITNACEPVDTTVHGVEWTPKDGTLEVILPALPFNVGRDGDFPLDVSFNPGPASLDGRIRVDLRYPDGGFDEIEVAVRGRVLDGPPCQLEAPDAVRLAVPPRSAGEVEIELTNVGPRACWLWGVELAEDGDPGFTLMSAPEGPVDLVPGGALLIQLRYDRGDAEPGAGTELVYRRMVAPGEDPLARIPVENAP